MVNRYFKIIAVVALVSAGFGEQVLADSGADHKTQQTTPIKLGTSGGNINDKSSAFCCSGTLGALVKDNSGNLYILSNNHVLARTNQALVNEDISHRGLIDANCQVKKIVADLTSYPNLLTSNVDAAIAVVKGGEVDTTGAILDIGVPATTTVGPSLNMAVAKSGRTTGLTCGTIGSTGTTVNVQYQKNCGSGKKFTIKYTGQIVVSGSGFSAGGDSGSLVVTTDHSNPVGLLFAGSSSTTIANPIGDVLSKITPPVTIVSGTGQSVACPLASASPTSATLQKNQSNMTGPSDAVVEFATSIKEQHETGLMADPAVMGVGIGASDEDPSEAVIVIYLEQGRSRRPIPAEIDGVRTKTILSDRIRAFGWNESEHASCTVK